MDLLSFLLPPPTLLSHESRGWDKAMEMEEMECVRIHENEREQETTRAVNNWIHMLQKISKDSVVMS